MTRTGTVVETEGGRLMARVVRSEACAHCGQCAHAREEAAYYPLPKGEYKIGDTVEIQVPDGSALPAALLGYGLPLAVMLLGLVLGSVLGISQMGQAALAVAGVAVGYGLLRMLEPRLKKNGRFGTRVRHCPGEDEGGRE